MAERRSGRQTDGSDMKQTDRQIIIKMDII